MILVKSKENDPYYNLALEEYLLNIAKDNHCIVLYLWQNANTIVIGRNQNAYTECNLDYANQNGIKIARRMTGGGAVYHDLGNLNFSIVAPKDLFDISKNNKLIIKALNLLGIEIIKTGRNDFLVNDKKISGNAYYSNEDVGLHHGTLLVNSDLDVLEQALMTSDSKTTLRGISSIKSRVSNITEYLHGISIKDVEKSLINVFVNEFGPVKTIEPSCNLFSSIISKLKSNDWIFGEFSDYLYHKKVSFEWGYAEYGFKIVNNKINEIIISSDSVDLDSIQFTNSYIKNNLDYINEKKNIDYQPSNNNVVCNDLLIMLNVCLKDIFTHG